MPLVTTWKFDLKSLREKYPNPTLTEDQKTELLGFFIEHFEYKIPTENSSYSSMSIHLSCLKDHDKGLSMAIGACFTPDRNPTITFPHSQIWPDGEKNLYATNGIKSGLLSFYPSLTQFYSSTIDEVEFEVSIKYIHPNN